MIRPRATGAAGSPRRLMDRQHRPSGRLAYESGFGRGRRHGYERGYAEGLQRSRDEAGSPFDGLSIVLTAAVPAHDQARLLDGARAHTPGKLERITLQTGSADDPEWLAIREAGIRCAKPAPASCRINQGLRLARGRTMLIWQQPVAPEPGWLEGLQGLHGTDGLVRTTQGHRCGEALLLDRASWQRLGYLDEGFGSLEERLQDYALRANLQGIRFVVADAEGQREPGLAGVLTSDRFMRKWGPVPELIEEGNRPMEERALRSTDLYPTHVVAQGPASLLFWIEDGVRYPLQGSWLAEATRLSQADLAQLPRGGALTAQEIMQRLATLSSTPSRYGLYAEGVLLRAPGGQLFQSQRGKLRRLVGELASGDWHLERRAVFPITEEEAATHPRGLPIIAPPVLFDPNL